MFRNLTGGIGAGTTELHIVRPLFVDQDYILLFLKSPHFIETGIPKMTGTAGQKRVPTEYFAHSPFPLPPLAEQHRIVAKVDELMGLCDRLEAARAGREAVRDRLAAASLARLNAPDPETFQADARFALDALPALYDYYSASGVIDKIDNYLFDKALLLIGEDGANLINRSTPIAFIARGKYWVNNHAHVLDGTSEEFLRYLELFINAIDLKPYVTGTAQPKMNQAKMNSIPVALPPLGEQRRIVAKVDELIALCDRLEANLATADETRRRLLEALLAEALAPDDAREMEAAE